MRNSTAYSLGGIWCSIHIGMLYDEKLAGRVRSGLRSVLGSPAKLFGAGVSLDMLEAHELEIYVREGLKDMLTQETSKNKPGLMHKFNYRLGMRHNEASRWRNRYERAFDRYETFPGSGVLKPEGRAEVTAARSNMERALKSEEQYKKTIVDTVNQIMNSFGFAIVRNRKLLTVGTAGFSDKTKLAHLEQYFKENVKKMPVLGNGWYAIITVAHPLAARFESETAYPDKRYKGFGMKVMYDFAHAAAMNILSRLGRKSGDIRYGYILSRVGYEGKRLMIE